MQNPSKKQTYSKEGEMEPSLSLFSQEIAQARQQLASASAGRLRAELCHARGSVNRLLLLLWHPCERVRVAAALALPGGDGHRVYVPQIGHFAGALLRRLGAQEAGATPQARLEQVAQALNNLLMQSADDFRGMANMNYSFLGGALYLALLGTCRDTLASVRRLRAAQAHLGICHLLFELKRPSIMRRLNALDAGALIEEASRALAALPPASIPAYWNGLGQGERRRRVAYADALHLFEDKRAVPYLLEALQGQYTEVTIAILRCLGRLKDPRAIPELERLGQSRNRAVRLEALTALNAILRSLEKRPSRLLLRPSHPPALPQHLLRPHQAHRPPEETTALLRSYPPPENGSTFGNRGCEDEANKGIKEKSG